MWLSQINMKPKVNPNTLESKKLFFFWSCFNGYANKIKESELNKEMGEGNEEKASQILR